MNPPVRYRISLADEEAGDYLYLRRLHQENFMDFLSRHTACFYPTPDGLEFMACMAAQDLTGNTKLITEEYLGTIKSRMLCMPGAEDATCPYLYIPHIPPLGDNENPELTDDRIKRLWMPGVVCAGIFTLGHGRDVVLAVWYQDEFALPIDERVVEQLRLIDRDRFDRYCYDDYIPVGGLD